MTSLRQLIFGFLVLVVSSVLIAQEPSSDELEFAYGFIWEEFERNFPGTGRKPELQPIIKERLQQIRGDWLVTYYPGIEGFEEKLDLRITQDRWIATLAEQDRRESGHWKLIGGDRVVLLRGDGNPRAFVVFLGDRWQLLDMDGETPLKPLRRISDDQSRGIKDGANDELPGVPENDSNRSPYEVMELSRWEISRAVIRRGECLLEENGDSIVVFGNGRLETAGQFMPPIGLKARVKTDVTNIRLYYGSGIVILNWERNPRELRVRDPSTGKRHSFPNKGFVDVNEWHDIEWIIDETSMTIIVDGEQRASLSGNYGKILAPAGIGAAHGSRVTIADFQVADATVPTLGKKALRP